MPAATPAKNMPVSNIKAPSRVTSETYDRHRASGRLADMKELIAIQKAVLESGGEGAGRWEPLARRILRMVPLACDDDFGLFTKGLALPELNVSAVLQEQLQIVLLTKEFDGHKMRCQHQPEPDASTMDVYVGEDLQIGHCRGTLPRMVIEVSIDAMKDKAKQTFAYVNNMVALWPIGYQFLMLGATVFPAVASSSFRLCAYYVVHDNANRSQHVAEIVLHEGTWCQDSIGCMIAAVACLCRLPLVKLSDRPVLTINSGVNHCIDISNGVVFKVFDYRTASSRENSKLLRLLRDRRRPMLSLKYLAATQELCGNDVSVIRYPYIAGSHVPTHVSHFSSLLKEIRKIHKNSHVFADLRLSNCVFKDDGLSRLIDFDWAGTAGKDVYPSGFNADIPDGVRHVDACAGHTLARFHDCYAAAGMMEFFLPDDSVFVPKWAEAIRLLREDMPIKARHLLQTFVDAHISLCGDLMEPSEPHTGSPPEGPNVDDVTASPLAVLIQELCYRSDQSNGLSTDNMASSAPGAPDTPDEVPASRVSTSEKAKQQQSDTVVIRDSTNLTYHKEVTITPKRPLKQNVDGRAKKQKKA
jgi:hypothetical protein